MNKNVALSRFATLLAVLALFVAACGTAEVEDPVDDPDEPAPAPEDPEDVDEPDEPAAEPADPDADPVPVRLAHCVSQTHSFHLGGEFMAERLEELAPGAFDFTFFPDCELGNEVTLFDLYGTDDIEMSIQYSSSAASVAPPLGFLAIPFQLDGQEHWERLMLAQETRDLLNNKLDESGVNFRIGSTGSFGIRNIYARDAIDTSSLEGFQGLRMRETESPIMIEVWNAVGINPVAIPFPELYSALESGVVEAAPNTPVGYDLGSHYEVAPHYHFTEHEATSAFIFVRENWYQELPDDLRAVLEDVFVETNDYMNEVNLEHNEAVLARFDEWGVTSHDVPESVRQEMADIVAPILEQAAVDLNMEDFHQLVQDTR